MPNYRRFYLPGGAYFFTVNLLDRSDDLLIRHIGALRRAWRETRRALPFDTLAVVVLPDHLHCMWRLPEDDHDFSTRWKKLKARFSRLIPRGLDAAAPLRRGERGVWQRRFWEHAIRDDDDYAAHVDYIHFNPVKHGYVSNPDDWRYSSWRWWKRDYSRPLRPIDIAAGER